MCAALVLWITSGMGHYIGHEDPALDPYDHPRARLGRRFLGRFAMV